jgi:hypothetical protein
MHDEPRSEFNDKLAALRSELDRLDVPSIRGCKVDVDTLEDGSFVVDLIDGRGARVHTFSVAFFRHADAVSARREVEERVARKLDAQER